MSRVFADHYAHPAIVPAMPWLPASPVRAPVLARAVHGAGGVTVQWSDAVPPTERATSFAIYRVDGPADAIDVELASNLVATRRAEPGIVQRFIDAMAEPGREYTYAVTALDRIWNESAPSGVRVTE